MNTNLAHLPVSDLDAIEQLPTLNASAYDAASLSDRSLFDWTPLPGSADGDLSGEQEIMVGRSRDLIRNNPVAAGGFQTLKDNIIGATLRLSAKPDYRLLGKDIEWARDWSKKTEAEFRSWADSTECDAGGSLTLLGLSLQMLGGSFMNGDGLALPIWKPRAGSRWSTRLHVMESDRLSSPYGLRTKKGLYEGVQSDKHGQPVEYWISKNHPGDKWSMLAASAEGWERIPAFTSWGRRRVIHLHDKERAGQSRAKPLISAVMRELKMAGKYNTSELQTKIANSLIAGVLESDLDPDSMNSIFGESAEQQYKDFLGGFKAKLQSGAIIKAPPGTHMNLMASGRNSADFDQYMTTVLRYIATGLNIPYELLLKDFSKTNYSSARAALLEAWRYFHGRRRWLSDYWLNAVYELWLEEAIDLGRIEAPGFYDNRYAYAKCRWIFSGRGWVDPVKEAKAATIRMENNLSTLEQECAEQGLDWEEVLEQKAHEENRAEGLGISLSSASSRPDLAMAQTPTQDNSVSQETGATNG